MITWKNIKENIKSLSDEEKYSLAWDGFLEEQNKKMEYAKNQFQEHNCNQLQEANQNNCSEDNNGKIKIVYDNYGLNDFKEWIVKVHSVSQWYKDIVEIQCATYCPFCGSNLKTEIQDIIDAIVGNL